jgi:pimeloyl-ACP methyl ester carboxylesterase
MAEQVAQVGDLEICYETFGSADDPALLLVMGLGTQMIAWPVGFCRQLAERGFHVIRYDNRDTGRSTRIAGRVKRSTLLRAFAGRRVRAPYSIADMAMDGFGLLDHLGIDSAHVAGVSMGGMIVQTMAITQPRRVRSLTSIMSTTGKRTVGWQHPSLLPTLFATRGAGKEAYVRTSTQMWQLIGSPGYPQTDEEIARRAEETFDRGVSASGVMRQMLAILTQPNRSARLHGLRMPALVIHGLADKMVHASGGRATSAAIPGSELLLIDGMGHDTPPALFETITSAIRRPADRAS